MTVFAAWVTTSGQAWADFDVFMPGRWEKDLARRRAAGIPRGLGRKTKPQLAEDQLERLLKTGLPSPGGQPPTRQAGDLAFTDLRAASRHAAILSGGSGFFWLRTA